MANVSLPYNWEPRPYQKAAWDSWLGGCNRQLLVWHRRAGKDDLNLRMHAVGAFNRVGTYWHMLPEYEQARKAIWDAVNPHTGKRRIDEAFPDEIVESRRDKDMFIRFINGSTWQVVGSDSFNSLVGTPPVGITFSEWALADPTAWAYLSPILADNGGWASFITTPRGNNHVKGMLDGLAADDKWFTQLLTVDDTKAVSKEAIEEQRRVYAAIFGDDMAEMLIQQEFYCSFAGALVGSYWGSEINAAEREGRICKVDVDASLPVHTAWDLGQPSNNPIWCFQIVNNVPHIVDFYRPESDDLEVWCKWLNDRCYSGYDYVPHDIFHQNWGTQRTRIQMMSDFGRRPVPVKKVPVSDGITAGRETLKIARFDSEKCKLGLEGLRNYRREWDDELKRFRDHPIKDWSEHIGSAWRYLGLAWREIVPAKIPQPSKFIMEGTGTGIIKTNLTIKELIERNTKKRKEND